ncbi:Uncharacterised protein [Mycobacteroides abscessus]|nr:Uncharacterised protein [Mycobacteroides abscessus]
MPSPSTDGRCAKAGIESVTPIRIMASYKAICRGVEGSRSSPRSTWVIFINASSTGFTKVYNGSPLPRVSAKSGTTPAAKVVSPRTKSFQVMS